MRRLVTLIALVGAVIGLVALGWVWWTIPPVDGAGRLAATAATVPADADGLLVVSQPRRTARWLATHAQSLALLKLAAPQTERALPKVRGFVAALTDRAAGPLALWWRGGEVAAAGEVDAASAMALERLAALEGLAVRTRTGGTVAGASAASLLDPASTTRVPSVDRGELSALARVGARWWRIRADRSRLELFSGIPPELPSSSGPAALSTSDLAALAAPASPPDWLPHAPAAVLAGAGGWALAMPDTEAPLEVQRLLRLGGDVPAAAPPGARHWRGVLGELWVLPGKGVAIASRPELLAQLRHDGAGEESGLVRGPDLARLCTALAEAADGIPGGAALSRTLSRAATALEALRTVRWRLRPEGGHILLEW